MPLHDLLSGSLTGAVSISRTPFPEILSMTAEQQDSFVYEILQFTMPDGSNVPAGVKAETIIEELGLPDIPQLRRLIAIGAARTQHQVRRKLASRRNVQPSL